MLLHVKSYSQADRLQLSIHALIYIFNCMFHMSLYIIAISHTSTISFIKYLHDT